MKYDFDNVVNRRGTNSVKFSESYPDSLEMWIADMDFKVLPKIKEAIKAKADIDAYGYCYPQDEYFESYIKWGKEQHNITLKKEWMIFSTGVVASIDSIFKRLTKPGDEVVMFTPAYNVFFNCIKNNNLKCVSCPFIYENGEYSIDWEKLESLLSRESVKVFLLCNPHNPSGKIFSKEELIRMGDIAKKHNVLIISDGIHCDITRPDRKYVPLLEVEPKYKDHIIMLVSPTKAFNMAGIQSSIIVVPNHELKAIIEKGIGADDLGDPNYFACEATIAAFNHGAEYNKQLREYVFKNKQYVEDFIKDNNLKLHVVGGDATYLMWIDISHYSKDSDKFVKELNEKYHVHLASGSIYGEEGRTFVRVNVATSLENVKEFCVRIKKFLN